MVAEISPYRSGDLIFSSYLVSVQYKLWEGESEEAPITLIPTSLQRVGNYDLAGEDPAMYDGMDPSTPREWKDVPLPVELLLLKLFHQGLLLSHHKQILISSKGCWKYIMPTQMSLSHLEWMPVKTMRKPG